MKKNVKEKFDTYPGVVRQKLEILRQLILDYAKMSPAVGELEETLKWGEPAYLTSKTKSGTTIRIDWKRNQPEQYGMYVNCKTNLIDTFSALFPDQFTYDGNRAILFSIHEDIPQDAIKLFISMALRYHIDKA